MTYNGRIQSFLVGTVAFTPSAANGVYVEKGTADAPTVVNRLAATGTGVIHDVDGTDDAATTPPLVKHDLIFQGANPAAHAEYIKLCGFIGKHGTLTIAYPGASSTATTAVIARLVKVSGNWEAPYQQGVRNTMAIRAEWQLKALI